jgi:hypothetical protein
MKVLLFTIFSLLLILSVNSYNIDIKSEILTENKEILRETIGSEMQYYELNVPTNYRENNDLVIESSLTKEKELISSPLVIISLEPLSHDTNEKQWICNQLGGETCFLPAKYLQGGKKVYIGVFCKECQYNLKYSFTSETKLKLGETTMFHLKKGDSKIFDLTLTNSNDFKEYINIVSFNLRMTKYSMKVQIVDNDKSKDSKEANVLSNWIGGQQSLIYPKNFITTGSDSNNLLNYSFKIVIYAHEAGVFNIEATSGNTVVALGNSNLRFDTVTSETPICYYYDTTGNKDKKIIVDLKSINGDITVYTNQDKIPTFDDYTRKFTVNDEKEEKLTLDTKDNMRKWFLCVETKDTAYFNIHIYNESTEKRVQTYKNLLYSKYFTYH